MLAPHFFWCVAHGEVHRDDGLAFADGRVHRTLLRNGCTMVGPYATSDEAVEWGTKPNPQAQVEG